MQPSIQISQTTPDSQAREFSRLLTAAVVNLEFRNLLLTNPYDAISDGYNGEKFIFDSESQSLIFSIRANSLEEFVEKLMMDIHAGIGPNENREKPQCVPLDYYHESSRLPKRI